MKTAFLALALSALAPAVLADCGGSKSSCTSGKGHAHHAAAAQAGEAADSSDAVLASYLRLSSALASDDARAAAAEAKVLASRADERAATARTGEKPLLDRMATAARRITGADIAADRKAFLEISNAALQRMDLVGTGDAAVHVFECPMYPGSWAQASARTANPFYGASMLSCGVAKDAKPQEAGTKRP